MGLFDGSWSGSRVWGCPCPRDLRRPRSEEHLKIPIIRINRGRRYGREGANRRLSESWEGRVHADDGREGLESGHSPTPAHVWETRVHADDWRATLNRGRRWVRADDWPTRGRRLPWPLQCGRFDVARNLRGL